MAPNEYELLAPLFLFFFLVEHYSVFYILVLPLFTLVVDTVDYRWTKSWDKNPLILNLIIIALATLCEFDGTLIVIYLLVLTLTGWLSWTSAAEAAAEAAKAAEREKQHQEKMADIRRREKREREARERAWEDRKFY